MELAGSSARPPKAGTYWVVEHKLLAGPYPGAQDPADTPSQVQPLLDAGLAAYLNLMEAHEANWGGDPFTPYEPALIPGATMLRLPIEDRSVPSAAEMADILDTIDAHLDGGVYLHCWGGVGRTGTVVGCWLLRHRLATPSNVIETLQRLREADTVRGHRRSPENDLQEQFILDWREP